MTAGKAVTCLLSDLLFLTPVLSPSSCTVSRMGAVIHPGLEGSGEVSFQPR